MNCDNRYNDANRDPITVAPGARPLGIEFETSSDWSASHGAPSLIRERARLYS